MQPDSSYTIKVTGPAEKIHFVTTIHHTNDCDGGGPYPGDSDDAWRDEPGRTFTIEGHLRDPNDPRRIGGCTKTMSTLQSDPNDVQACFKRNEDQTPWFMDHYALAAKPDASLYPVTTTTTWNLLYRP